MLNPCHSYIRDAPRNSLPSVRYCAFLLREFQFSRLEINLQTYVPANSARVRAGR